MPRKQYLLSAIVLLLASCASRSQFSEKSPYKSSLFESYQRDFLSNKNKVVFLFEEDREGQIDVCPCDLLPMGGVHKSSAYIQKTRSQEEKVLFLSAGNAVVPGKYYKPLSEEGRRQLPTLVEYYNQNSLVAYGAHSRDFLKGLDFLNMQLKGAKFPVISSNIVDEEDEPLFTTFYDLHLSEEAARTARLISLSSDYGPDLPDGLQRLDPVETFQNLQTTASSPEHIDMWIVLGDLASEEVERLRLLSKKPMLIFGGRGMGQGIVIDDQASSLWVSGLGEGKSLNRVELALGEQKGGTFLDPFRWKRSADLYSKLLLQHKGGLDVENARDTLNYLMNRVPKADGNYQLYRAEEIPLF